ncbi:MAG: hypothetical protein HUU57_00385 [Bdellovibrio sp.]|nr:hypothetical protein [Bdellovibrio sp.]
MKWLLVFLTANISACATVSDLLKNREAETSDNGVPNLTRASEESEIINAEKVLSRGRFEEARILYRDFSARKPQSVFYQSAKMGEAQALLGIGQPQESADLYREVYLKTLKEQPRIAAMALFNMSFAYEALGDDLKTVAALLDAKRMADNLPLETAYAEIPARLAAVYGRQGRDNEARLYLAEADKGIVKVMEAKGSQLQKEWLAKTYFQMGSVSTNQLSADSFGDFVQGQRWVQVYLIKALKLADPIWSQRSLEKLQEVYRDLYTHVESATSRSQQNGLGADLLDLCDQADLYRPLGGRTANKLETEFFQYIQEVRKKVEGHLYSGGETMPLTVESERRNSLKRSLPAKPKSNIPLPPKVVPSEDPNL